MSDKSNKGKGTPVTTGTDNDDILVVVADENKVNGGDGNDIIIGGSGSDRVNAGDGDDVITGGLGDDTIYGNGGFDTAVFSGDIRDYLFSEGKGNSFIVSGPDGVDTLKQVESLQFENLSVSLDGSNNAPLVSDKLLTVTEEGSGTVNLLEDAWDYEGDALHVVDGNAEFNFSAAGSYDFLAVGESASESVAFTVTDGENVVSRTLTVSVTGVNDTPVAGNDSAVTVEDDAPIAGNVLANDADVDSSDTLAVTGINGVLGTVTLISGAMVTIASDGNYSYDQAGAFDSLNDGESTIDSFTYSITDGNGGTADATVEITVSGVTDATGGGGGEGGRSGLATDYLDLGLGEIIDYRNAFWNAGTFGTDDADAFIYDLWYSYASTFYMKEGDDIVQFRADAGNGFYANRFYLDGGENTLALVTNGSNYIASNTVGSYINPLTGNDTVKFQANGGAIFNNPVWLGTGDNYISMQVNDTTDSGIAHASDVAVRGNLFDAEGGSNTFILQINSTTADVARIFNNNMRVRGGEDDSVFIIEQNAVNAENAEVLQNTLSGSAGNDIMTIFGGDSALNDNARVYYNSLNGGAGDDILTIHTTASNSGNNYLYGGDGNDILHSGAGIDVMYGHDGDDVFVFDDESGSDRVLDFGRGNDCIDLTGVTGVNEYADLAITQSGNSYSVDLGNGDVLLVVGQNHALVASDFTFGI